MKALDTVLYAEVVAEHWTGLISKSWLPAREASFRETCTMNMSKLVRVETADIEDDSALLDLPVVHDGGAKNL